MSNLDGLDLSHLTPTGTARYPLPRVSINSPRPVVLIVKPATEANEGYAAARKNQAMRSDVLKRVASIYARHVIAGWENVNRADGTPIPYSFEDGEVLLHKIIDAKRADDMFGGLMHFCGDADNFCEGAKAPDADDLGNG